MEENDINAPANGQMRQAPMQPHLNGAHHFTPAGELQVASAERLRRLALKLANDDFDNPAPEQVAALRKTLDWWDYNRIDGGNPRMVNQAFDDRLRANAPGRMVADMATLIEEPHVVRWVFEDSEGNELGSGSLTQAEAGGMDIRPDAV